MSTPGHHRLPQHHRTSARIGARYPRGWEVTSEDYETMLIKLPPDITRVTAVSYTHLTLPTKRIV